MSIDEKTFEHVLNSLPYAIFVMEDRKIIFANTTVEKVFGWKPEELLGKDTEMLYRNKDEYLRIGENFYPKLEKESSFSEIFPCKRKDGKELVCNIDASRLGEHLEQKRVVAMYEDITDRIEAEKEMEESEEQYRHFIENTSEIVQNMAPDGRFLNVNKAWYKTFGYDEKDLDTLNFFEVVKADSKQHLEEIFKKAVAGEPVSDEEIVFETKGKDKIILTGNLIPRSFYGEVVSIRCFFRDITENKKIQDLINKKIEELQMFNELAVNRELKMIELKKKIKELEEQLQH